MSLEYNNCFTTYDLYSKVLLLLVDPEAHFNNMIVMLFQCVHTFI